jgi:hypothetical protein
MTAVARAAAPTGTGLTWSLGLAASLATHAGAALLLAAMLQPRPITDQPQPKSQIRIETQEVAQSRATAQAPAETAAASASVKGAQALEGRPPESRASAAALPQDRLAATTAPEPVTRPAATTADRLLPAAAPEPVKPTIAATLPLAPVASQPPPVKAALPPAETIGAVMSVAEPVQATAAPAETVAAASPDTARIKPAAPPQNTIAAAVSPSQPVAAAATPAEPVRAAPALATDLPPLTDPAPLQQAAPANGTALPQAAPDAQPLDAAPAEGNHVVAALAWSGGADTGIDAQSLKAIQSFMQPGNAAAETDDVHDALSSVLSSVPCARLQAEFNPETGNLELRGHVPDAADRAPILKALQAQLGDGIKVADGMLILPSPQCGALSGIADVGLPQSTDQNTNPRVIGADAQARAYDYSTGQTIQLDIGAPDYDAYLYVDYFDAGGQVIHFIPNDSAALSLVPARTTRKIALVAHGQPVTVGPPYGQEIATAFAASTPLYDGLRPLSEPAAPYLEWLKGRVAEARARNPDFKGEWVYFFVSTQER